MIRVVPSMNDTDKTPAVKIEITRAEGPHALCGHKQTFEGPDCWNAARGWLYSQSHTFPAEGGYDKVDFVVTFEDEEEYEGRLGCKHHNCIEPDLTVGTHIRDYQEFMAGQRAPTHMTPEQYNNLMEQYAKAGHVKAAQEFLANYEVPRG